MSGPHGTCCLCDELLQTGDEVIPLHVMGFMEGRLVVIQRSVHMGCGAARYERLKTDRFIEMGKERDPDGPRCDFCNKPKREVKQMVQAVHGPTICNECHGQCVNLFAKGEATE